MKKLSPFYCLYMNKFYVFLIFDFLFEIFCLKFFAGMTIFGSAHRNILILFIFLFYNLIVIY